MGYSDFKLLAAIGAFVGWQMLPLVIALSAFISAAIVLTLISVEACGKTPSMPLGPHLSIAAFIALIWGSEMNTPSLHKLLACSYLC
ncbi:MAG: hypothetical protein A6F72_07875 [Cycloclasticus sp. symbiont of Poecilosclerida sp. N]|nr:MAG: hypothetical protein A6F72_07875 [Cycloclasticus sp. symbiont of Poecilosclerida sp. N]